MKTKTNTGLYLAILAVSFAVLAVPTCAYQRFTTDRVTITVTDKERVVTGTGDSVSSKYLVFTETETFKNADATFHFKFNSSDVYGRIKTGATYECLVYGWRIPFFSTYRNIVTLTELPDASQTN